MNDLEITVRQANEIIASAKQVRQQAIAAADQAYCDAAQPSHARLQHLQARYEELAFDLACEADRPPRYRSGSFQRPDDVEVREEGVHMCWHDDYDFRNFTATWAELQAEETARAAQGDQA